MASRYEYYIVNDDSIVAIYDDTWIGQTFTPQIDHTLEYFKAKLKRVLTPGDLTVSLYLADGNHKPTGSALSSGTTDADDFSDAAPGSFQTLNIPNYKVTKDIEYCLVLAALAGDVDNRVAWRRDATASAYTRGVYISSANGGGTWSTSATIDAMFEEWGSRPEDIGAVSILAGTRPCVRVNKFGGMI